MTTIPLTTHSDTDSVRSILEAAGPRGASHEDFVEAGLANGYISALRRLVDEDGLQIRTDFTTGQPRWVLVGSRQLAAA
jgi:hypothetical protein